MYGRVLVQDIQLVTQVGLPPMILKFALCMKREIAHGVELLCPSTKTRVPAAFSFSVQKVCKLDSDMHLELQAHTPSLWDTISRRHTQGWREGLGWRASEREREKRREKRPSGGGMGFVYPDKQAVE